MPTHRHSPLWPNRLIKPRYGTVEIDWAHPLAQGLGGLWLFNEGGLAAGSNGLGPAPLPRQNQSGTVATGHGAYGPSAYFNNTGYWTIPNLTSPTTDSPKTIIGFVRHRVASSDAIFQYGQVTDTTANACLYLDSTHHVSLGNVYTAGGTVVASTATLSLDAWGVAGVSILSGTSTLLLINSVVEAAGGLGSNPSAGGACLGVAYNNGSAVAGTQWQGDIGWIITWPNRALTSQELLAVSADPYCVLRPIVRRTYGFVGGAAPASIVPQAMHHYLHVMGR